MRSPFAADVLPDGRRRYSPRAVVARRRLLGAVLLGAGATAVGIRLGGDPDAGAADAGGAGATALAETGNSLTDPRSPWVVVNKQHPIDPPDFAPAELVTVAGRPVAAAVVPDLEALLAAAAADGLTLLLTSGFRSRADQTDVHQQSVRRNGIEVAETVSARPGHSEHQTGLAVDLAGASSPDCAALDCFAATAEARWLAEHAGSFGFLLRYPADRTDVTGYAAESWHYRWVGRDLCARMDAVGLRTLEEFFGVTGGPVYS